jgi:DNA polymerase-3 subunit delta
MPKGVSMIYTLSGPNSFALQLELQNIVHTFIERYGDFGIERMDASQSTAQELLESMQAIPFLAGKRMVLIQDPSDNKQLIEKFPNIVDTISEDTDIVFVQTKFDKRSSFFKFLKKHSEFMEFEELQEPALIRWIQDYVSSQQGVISTTDARFLIARVGMSQRTIQSELRKLLNYSTTISKESIELLTVPTVQSTIFDLIDAAFTGNTAKALDIYKEQRLQKVEPLQIVAMLVWQLHILAIIKLGNGKTADTIARDAKLNPYVVRKSSTLVQKMSLSQIKSLVSRTRDLERRLKRELIDSDEALQELLIHFK